MKMTPQKKAARTRAQNRAQRDYYERITRPGMEQLNDLLNSMNAMLRTMDRPVRLAFRPGSTGRALKHNATFGTLVGFEDAWLLKVKIDGYKRPQVFHPAFWERA